MADYYSLVAKAVGAMDQKIPEARHKIYDRARAALLSEVHKWVPSWEQSEIMAEQLLLELAIGEVEAELLLLECAPPRLGTPTVAPINNVPLDPNLPSSHNEQRNRGSLAARCPPNVRRSGKEAARRPDSPPAGKSEPTRHTWMTDLLARASGPLNEDLRDFAPKRGSSRLALASPPGCAATSLRLAGGKSNSQISFGIGVATRLKP
jgi:hypothetical protein